MDTNIRLTTTVHQFSDGGNNNAGGICVAGRFSQSGQPGTGGAGGRVSHRRAGRIRAVPVPPIFSTEQLMSMVWPGPTVPMVFKIAIFAD